MAKLTKEEREQAKERLRWEVRECAPDGTATLLIVCTGGSSSVLGQKAYFSVDVIGIRDARPRILACISWDIHVALGYRMAKAHTIMIPGCGDNRSHHIAIASDLAKLCQHPVQVEGDYRGVVR